MALKMIIQVQVFQIIQLLPLFIQVWSLKYNAIEKNFTNTLHTFIYKTTTTNTKTIILILIVNNIYKIVN